MYYVCTMYVLVYTLILFFPHYKLVNHWISLVMEFITSEKLKTLLIVDSYKFNFQKLLKSDVQRWVCIDRNCKCALKISADRKFILEKLHEHNHENVNEKVLNRQRVSNSLKRKAMTDISSRPAKLICQELKREDVHTLDTKDIGLIRRNMHRARLTKHPVLPKSMEETHDSVGQLDIRTNKDENFLLVNDKEANIIIFSTTSNLELLCKSEKIFVDGTFKSCPKFFYQIFTLIGFINNVYIPLVFSLLPGKTKVMYTQLFEHIQYQCRNLIGKQFSPIEILADFESAIHGAIEDMWPNTTRRGCRFHLGQSWWKRMQNVGLAKIYQEKSEESDFLKCFFGLPFLHPDNVLDCFTDDFMSLQPDDNIKIVQFTDYVFENYISPEAPFPPEIWARYSSDLTRTTNACESYHAKLNSSFYTAHPNIYNFIDVLLEFQCNTYVKSRSSRVCINVKETFVQKEMLKLNQNIISTFEFVKNVSYKFQPKKCLNYIQYFNFVFYVRLMFFMFALCFFICSNKIK